MISPKTKEIILTLLKEEERTEISLIQHGNFLLGQEPQYRLEEIDEDILRKELLALDKQLTHVKKAIDEINLLPLFQSQDELPTNQNPESGKNGGQY